MKNLPVAEFVLGAAALMRQLVPAGITATGTDSVRCEVSGVGTLYVSRAFGGLPHVVINAVGGRLTPDEAPAHVAGLAALMAAMLTVRERLRDTLIVDR